MQKLRDGKMSDKRLSVNGVGHRLKRGGFCVSTSRRSAADTAVTHWHFMIKNVVERRHRDKKK